MPEARIHHHLLALTFVMAALFCVPQTAPGKALDLSHFAQSELWEPKPERVRADFCIVAENGIQGTQRDRLFVSTGEIVIKTVNFLYDDWNLVYERTSDGSGALVRERKFSWGIDVSGTPQGAGGIGGLMLVTEVSGGVTKHRFPVYDNLGNLIALVDTSNGTSRDSSHMTPSETRPGVPVGFSIASHVTMQGER